MTQWLKISLSTFRFLYSFMFESVLVLGHFIFSFLEPLSSFFLPSFIPDSSFYFFSVWCLTGYSFASFYLSSFSIFTSVGLCCWINSMISLNVSLFCFLFLYITGLFSSSFHSFPFMFFHIPLFFPFIFFYFPFLLSILHLWSLPLFLQCSFLWKGNEIESDSWDGWEKDTKLKAK